MIYTRMIEEIGVVLDYNGTNEDLSFEMILTIKNMIDNKDIESYDLAVIILYIFKKIDDADKITLVDMLIKDIKGGNLWQELEDLSKSEKK